MTMPSLIAKHRQQALKAQFLKAYSIGQQQLLSAKTEFGVDKFRNYCVSYVQLTQDSSGSFPNRDECYALLNEQVKIVGKCNYKAVPKNYNKSADAYVDRGAITKPKYLLSDGMCYDVTVNSSELGITFDINGAGKGPNALGHDIFSFWVDSKDRLTGVKMTGYFDDDTLDEALNNCNGASASVCGAIAQQNGLPCTKNSNQKGNGIGCSWFAINDTCPDDPTKKYWECLP